MNPSEKAIVAAMNAPTVKLSLEAAYAIDIDPLLDELRGKLDHALKVNDSLTAHIANHWEPLLAEKDRVRIALESLTPGGSEYHNDPDRCVAYVRDARHRQHERILQLSKRCSEKDKRIAELEQETKFLKDVRDVSGGYGSMGTKK